MDNGFINEMNSLRSITDTMVHPEEKRKVSSPELILLSTFVSNNILDWVLLF